MVAVMILSLLTIILTSFSLKLVPDLLKEADLVAKNYRGEIIPVGYGLLFVINITITLIVGTLLGYYEVENTYLFLTLILVMGFVGILDDALGNKSIQGFKGHFRAFILDKRLTTGFIKAVLSLIFILFINLYWYQKWLDIIINTLLILLTTNFINLLDLRPGRALKVTLFNLVVILLLRQEEFLLIIPIMIVLILSLPLDLQAKGMMGDIGANVLGVVVGFLMVINLRLFIKIIMVLLLIAIHIYTEYYSLSKLIKDNRVLFYIDQIGRD